MNRFRNKSILFLIFAVAGLWLFMGSALAEESTNTIFIEDSGGFQAAADVASYWTAERMQNAIPMEPPKVVMPEGEDSPSALTAEKALQEVGEPGYAPGWSPSSGLPQPDETVGYTFDTADSAPMTYGSAPTNPLSGPYPPFQRWTWFGNYTTQDRQTVGKLFFTVPGVGNFVCSASVIGQGTIATAAHCLKSDLNNNGTAETWHTNWNFCPAYYAASGSGGPHPSRGCWGWMSASVSSGWASASMTDRDYGCIGLATSGTVHGTRVGNVTGWAGRAWNWSSYQPMFAIGYPSGPTWPAVSGLGGEGPRPFPGYHMIVAFSTEWYEVNMTSGDGLVSKYIGNDMTGGSSGGPWWMNVAHRTGEYTDTDGSGATDPPGCGTLTNPCVPQGPYINGVNSHKRCRFDCWKPISTAGIFFQEMGSPQFRRTTADTDETEDIFAWCFAHD